MQPGWKPTLARVRTLLYLICVVGTLPGDTYLRAQPVSRREAGGQKLPHPATAQSRASTDLLEPGLYIEVNVFVGRVDDSYEKELPFVLKQIAPLVERYKAQCTNFIGPEVPPPVALFRQRIPELAGARIVPCAGEKTPTLLGPIPTVAESHAALAGEFEQYGHEVVIGAVAPVVQTELERFAALPSPGTLPGPAILVRSVQGYFAAEMARRPANSRQVPSIISVTEIARSSKRNIIKARMMRDGGSDVWYFIYVDGHWRVIENDTDVIGKVPE